MNTNHTPIHFVNTAPHIVGTPEGKTFISDKRHKYLAAIIQTTRDEQWSIARDAYLSLINLSGANHVAERILDTEPTFIEQVNTFFFMPELLYTN